MFTLRELGLNHYLSIRRQLYVFSISGDIEKLRLQALQQDMCIPFGSRAGLMQIRLAPTIQADTYFVWFEPSGVLTKDYLQDTGEDVDEHGNVAETMTPDLRHFNADDFFTAL